MIYINKSLLDELTAKAKENPRLRASFDLRTTPEDNSQRILNALEPGTIVPIHRHNKSTETVAILRGKIMQKIYNDDKELIETFVVEAGGDIMGYSIPMSQWHTTECLVSGTVIMESKDGKYEPIAPEDMMTL